MVPSLRLALGADEPAVRGAYERLYGGDVSAIYATRLPFRERVRWMRARTSHRLETLPPSWIAFALTLTGTVGTTTLALPIATASVGPAVGIGLLLGLAAVTIRAAFPGSTASNRAGDRSTPRRSASRSASSSASTPATSRSAAPPSSSFLATRAGAPCCGGASRGSRRPRFSCVWLVAVNGALPSATLAGERGTAVAPLADVAGPIVDGTGGLFALLAMGIGSIAMSLALFYHVREWIPERGGRARFVTGVAPIVALFGLVEWLLLTDRASLTAAIAFVNAITGPLLSGVFPVFLLAASRGKGEYVPAAIWRFLNRPVVAGALYAFFLAVLFVHGFVLWDDPVQRAVAVASGFVTLGATVLLVERGSYRPQAVVSFAQNATIERWRSTSQTQAGPARRTFAWSRGRRSRSAPDRLDSFRPLRACGRSPSVSRRRRRARSRSGSTA